MFHGVKMLWKVHDDEIGYHVGINAYNVYDDAIDGHVNREFGGHDAFMDGDDDDDDDDDSGIAPAA